MLATYASVLIDTYLDEDFADASGATPPPGWANVVLGGDPAVDQWRFDNPGNRTIPGFETSPIAIFDSDFLSNNDQTENVALVSPVFNAANTPQVFLEFNQDYRGTVTGENASQAFVEVYNGTQWQPVLSEVQSTSGLTRLDISAQAAGVANAQVRFRWTGNWSYLWSVDDVKVVNALTPGVTVTGNPQVSEDNVPDPRNFQFALDSKPTSNVTISFAIDSKQLQPIAPLTFTLDNWNLPQAAIVTAVADGTPEGEDQKSPIQISVASADPTYNGFQVPNATATITDSTIPGFTSYRTVEKTYSDLANLAAANRNIARWLDIGNSYDKTTPGGAPGYDIHALELTNKRNKVAGGKPILYVEAGIHAREYAVNEVLTRFAEQVVAGYGTDANLTWLLDYFQLDINPVANPDGRKLAEQGYSWRKNTNPNPPAGVDPASFPNYGVDLNRNHTFEWNTVPGGSSGDPSDETYRGASAASEPETKAVENFVSMLFPNRKGATATTPGDPTKSGILLDLHTYGNTVLYSWGSTFDPAPNKDALRDLGLKFGYYTNANGTPYDVYQSVGLYPTDGATDDWAYGTFGIPSYTWELGTDFFESNDYFEQSIAPQVIPALMYAAKSVYRPYQTASAPESIAVATGAAQVVAGVNKSVNIFATADDTRYADSNADGIEEGTALPTPSNIKAARYSIDAPSWIKGTKTYKLKAADKAFDEPIESVVGKIDTGKLSVGRHTVFVESKDVTGTYGVPTAVFLDVLAAPKNAVVTRGKSSDDRLVLGKGNNLAYGGAGNDRLLSKAGTDLLLAGDGNDIVKGGSGDDLLYGGTGDDRLDGGGGNDKLYGEAGADQMVGGEGNDLLWGGEGNDVLIGGRGKDTYRLAVNQGTDTIAGFKVGQDRIDLGGTIGFAQVSVTQSGSDTLINFQKSTLAILAGVATSKITQAAFVPV